MLHITTPALRSEETCRELSAQQVLLCCYCSCLLHRQCYPLPGRSSDPSAAAAKGSEGIVPMLVNNGTKPLTGSHNASSSDSTQPTPEVRSSCPPGAIAVGSRCVKNSGSSRRAVAGTLASSVALLAAWQVAVVLVTALLAC